MESGAIFGDQGVAGKFLSGFLRDEAGDSGCDREWGDIRPSFRETLFLRTGGVFGKARECRLKGSAVGT